MSFPERLEPTSAYHLAAGTWPLTVVGHLQLSLPATVDAPPGAREAAGALLIDRVGAREIGDALLMLSELVTNAIRHARASPAEPIDVHIALAPDRIRVEVRDGGEGFDVAAPPLSGSGGGLGLVIVDRAASRWGASNDVPHCVWFELDCAAV